ncbi:MAG: hypothetical protein AB9900_11935 [Humidesulfovibrio sp.]
MGSRSKKLKKPRQEYYYATTAGKVTSFKIEFDPRTGQVALVDSAPNSERVTKEYHRKNKDKITTSAPINKFNITHDATTNIIHNFDHLFAIDTNTATINGKTISVASIYYMKERLITYKNIIQFDYKISYLIVNPKQGINPETIGWNILFKRHYNNEYFETTKYSLGVIVDSELGKHNAINNRLEPFYGNILLPSNVKLIYASADNPNDSLATAMISLCDRVSSGILENLRTTPLNLPIATNGDENFDGYFFLYPNDTSPKPGVTKFNFTSG